MSLGVLNNLSAVYAENNLSNTNNSLSKTLQQLSSGSKINSGADDAAGLSLVDGLQANQTALSQSETNATEGVGLLQVADGALSQVTNLLNRAVTLATEASNGTLNSSQDMAANQEYQSILSEISNIGSTTTYNQQQVFGGQTSIYTGDSSLAGASINSLNIRSLSSSSVGDTGGAMSYSSGENNVFMNLSSSTANAALTDTLTGGANGSTTLNVSYLVPGASGTSSTATAQISVGGNSGYENNVGGLIDAINQSGLGLSANFATQAQAGVQGGGSQTGIEISGGLVSAGVAPSAASTSGSLELSGLAVGATLAQGATVTIGQGSNTHTFTIGSGNNTLSTLAGAINTYAGANSGYNVAASVVTNGDGTQSLSLADSSGTNGVLNVTTQASPSATSPALNAVDTVTGVAQVTAVSSSISTGVSSFSTTDSNLTGSFAVTVTPASGSAVTETFVMGGTTSPDGNGTGAYDSSTKTFTVLGNSLGALENAINAQDGTHNTLNLGVTLAAGSATTGATAFTLTGNASGSSVGIVATNATYASTVTGATAAMTTPTNASGVASLNVAQSNAVTDTVVGSIAFSVAGTTYTFNMGTGTDTGTAFFTGNLSAGELSAVTNASKTNLGGLEALITARVGTSGTIAQVANASISSAGLKITAIGTANAVTAGSNSLQTANAAIGFYTPTLNNLVGDMSTGVLGLVGGTSGATMVGTIDAGATLSGSLVITNNGVTDTFVMGNKPSNGQAGLAGVAANGAGGNTIYTGANTLASLETAMNDWGSGTATGTLLGLHGGATGVSGAAWDALDLNASTTGAPGGGIYLQSTLAATTMSNGAGSTLAVEQSTSGSTSTVAAVTAVAGTASSDVIGTAAGSVSTGDIFTGSITLTNTPPSGSPVSETFVMGTSAHSGSAAGTLSGTTFTVNGNTLGDLQAAIASQQTSGANSLGLGLTASAGATGLTVANPSANGNSISVSGNSLVDTAVNLAYTAGSAYNTGISGSVADTTSMKSAATFASDSSAHSGIATISYSDGAGQSLSNTDLSSQANAQTSLNALNAAIADVAAQDGYIGAQINTLNSVSQVLSTQQENVQSAQNAVQATDYAQATSNMSKYEILSQTGIAALAQANSQQQAVLKLLQ